MRQFLIKRWFLLALAALIASGLSTGMRSPQSQVEPWATFVPPGATTAVILFLMSFSLDSRHFRESLAAPGPVVWAVLINYGLVPLIAWPLMGVQLIPDFATGLMIAASVPCTLAAASVWTRKARGNDAVSLLVTLTTNGICFAVTPLWLKLTTAHSIAPDTYQMSARLLWSVLLPTLAGQLLRRPPAMTRLANRHKVAIGVVAQTLILTMVLSAALKAGMTLGGNGRTPTLAALLTVWLTCIGVHLTGMLVAYFGGGVWGFSLRDRAAVAFAGSQKTLPIGLLLATDERMFGSAGLPFVIFPMLLYHFSQLFVDTVVADRLAARAAETESV